MDSSLSVLVNFWFSYNTIFLSSVNQPSFVISGYVKLVTLYCHAIFWETEGLGEGCVKIMQIVPCLELMTNLFLFIHNGGNEKLLYSPIEKRCSLFCYESFSKGYNVLNEFRFQSHMRFCLTQLSATRFYGSLSVYSRPLPSEKKAPLQPSKYLFLLEL